MASSSPSLFLLSPRTFSLPSLPQRLTPFHHRNIKTQRLDSRLSYRRCWSVDFPEGESDGQDCNFDCAVSHFNSRDFYRCHDFLEHLWYGAEEPRRTVIHGLLQCAVGFHHLFNQAGLLLLLLLLVVVIASFELISLYFVWVRGRPKVKMNKCTSNNLCFEWRTKDDFSLTGDPNR